MISIRERGGRIKGLVLAGGEGSRLRPITRSGPKQFIPVANRPIILYCIEDILKSDIREIGIILGDNHPEKVMDLLGEGGKFGANITYIHQGAPRGIAHAIGCARDFLSDDKFVVYLGDNLCRDGISEMATEFRSSSMSGMILLSRVPEPSRFGVAEIDAEGRIVDLVEKPEVPPSDLALAGIYFLTPEIFPIIDALVPSGRNELEITDALRDLMRSGRDLEARIITGWWKDTGRVEDILDANRLLLDSDDICKDGMRVGQNTHIHKSVKLIPPVLIGRECKIDSGAVVGPFVAVGDGCRIRRAVIRDTVLDRKVLIDCSRRIEKSLIGKGASIIERIRGSRAEESESLTLVLGENSRVVL